MECARITSNSNREGDGIMTDRLKQLEKLEDCVMSFWDRLDEDMQEEIREILDGKEEAA